LNLDDFSAKLIPLLHPSAERKSMALSWHPPEALLRVMISCFNLVVDGCADPLFLYDQFSRYFSPFLNDAMLGFESEILSKDLSGTNTFLNLTNRRDSDVYLHLNHWATWSSHPKPTRAVIALNNVSSSLQKSALNLGWKSFFTLPTSQENVTFFLFQNLAADIHDPISKDYETKLLSWNIIEQRKKSTENQFSLVPPISLNNFYLKCRWISFRKILSRSRSVRQLGA
jgi:hypothetical protein